MKTILEEYLQGIDAAHARVKRIEASPPLHLQSIFGGRYFEEKTKKNYFRLLTFCQPYQRCAAAAPRRWLLECKKEFIAVLAAWACYAVSASRRPDAVETFRIILPLGIAEI
jgi:hypothetical protein